ncbi:response regulator [Paenibacillus sp. IB182496]|uniref:Response regulator n=1 Tax=Paenibacillus sabuli TaxID=2772509 RepID=A0A927BUA6_9BACL|nr:response regulator [Paenibacillus sabuli]MBD2845634.1 response regulator [Paenibacillus sabuli]
MISMILVDDEEIIREGLRDCVDWASVGITICGEASDGKEALQKIKELRPDILLTDVVMPGMNGIELIQAIRTEAIPVAIIVLSAFENFQYIQSALRHDAADYLVKPFNETELALVMNKVVQQVKRNQLISEYIPEHALLPETGSRDQRISQDIARLIEDRYAEKLTVQDIAGEISLSSNHMMNIFKKETGETVGDYMTKVRMRHAKRMLRDPLVKIYEIAEGVGYADPNYFAKAFKKYTGLSPKDYRDGHL